uniref:Uncharacterized protein n=1 Tax=Lilium longiflorum TaxID=4690 RepID=F8UMA9_LILLO|nr:hypothetical protein [Lilium longiflorum]
MDPKKLILMPALLILTVGARNSPRQAKELPQRTPIPESNHALTIWDKQPHFSGGDNVGDQANPYKQEEHCVVIIIDPEATDVCRPKNK